MILRHIKSRNEIYIPFESREDIDMRVDKNLYFYADVEHQLLWFIDVLKDLGFRIDIEFKNMLLAIYYIGDRQYQVKLKGGAELNDNDYKKLNEMIIEHSGGIVPDEVRILKYN